MLRSVQTALLRGRRLRKVEYYSTLKASLGSTCYRDGGEECAKLLTAKWHAEKFVPSLDYLQPYLRRWSQAGNTKDISLVIDYLDGVGALFTSGLYISLIEAYCQTGDVTRGLNLFHEMCLTGVTPTREVYDSLLGKIANSGMIVEAKWLWNDMQSRSIPPTGENYAALALVLYASEGFPAVVKFIRSHESDEKFDKTEVMNSLIVMLNNKHDMAMASIFLEEIRSWGGRPSVEAQSSFVHCCVALGQMDEARSCIETMRKEGHEISIDVYNTVIRGYLHAEDFDKVADLVAQVEQSDSLKPNEHTYGMVMRAHEQLGDPAGVLAAFESMRNDGCELNEETVNIFIRAQVYSGNVVDVARIFLDEFSTREFKLSMDTQALVLESLNFIGQHKLTVEMFERLDLLGETTFPFLSQAHIIQAYEKCGKHDVALKRLAAFKRNVGKVGTKTLNAMLRTQLAVDYTEVKGTFLSMMEKRCVPNEQTFRILIDSFAMMDQEDMIRWALEEMKARSIPTGKTTVEALASAYIEMGQVSRGMSILEEASRRGMKPQLTRYTGLVRYFAKKDSSSIYELIENLCSKGVALEAEVFNIGLNALTRFKQVQDAQLLYDIMLGQGTEPNRETFSILVRTCVKHGLLTSAVQYFDSMVTSGFEPEMELCNLLLEGLGRAQDVSAIMVLYAAMLEAGVLPDKNSHRAILRGLSASGKFCSKVMYFRQRLFNVMNRRKDEQVTESCNRDALTTGRENGTEYAPLETQLLKTQKRWMANYGVDGVNKRRIQALAGVFSTFKVKDTKSVHQKTIVGLRNGRGTRRARRHQTEVDADGARPSDRSIQIVADPPETEENTAFREKPVLKRTDEDVV